MRTIRSLLRCAVCLSGLPSALGLPAPKHGSTGAVASDSELCSQVGVGLINAGGNAADAMVGTTICLGVVAPYHSGIGGGGYMVIRSSEGVYEDVDFREVAPGAAYENMFVGNSSASRYGGQAIAVPSELQGLAYLHEKHGQMKWHDVLAPSVEIARYGWKVTQDMVEYIEKAAQSYPGDFKNMLLNQKTWSIDFAPNGKLLEVGETMTRKRYASTLEKIALEGPDAFYSGFMANLMIDSIRAATGIITQEDFDKYQVNIREPVHTIYRGYQLYSAGVSTSGAIALSILKSMEHYPDAGVPEALNITTHRLDEAMKLGYAARTGLADPAFIQGVIEEEWSILQDAPSQYRFIDDRQTHNASWYKPQYSLPEHHGTTHVSAIDGSGLAISLTSTINTLFGSMVLDPATGVIFNNHMDDFSNPGLTNYFGYEPSPANFISPGKRPLSSATPTIVTHPNGTVYLVLGAAGGSRIISTTAQILWHILGRGLNATEAVGEKRWHDQLSPGEVVVEEGFDAGRVEYLRGKWHDVRVGRVGTSASVVRVLGEGGFEVAADGRLRDSGGVVV